MKNIYLAIPYTGIEESSYAQSIETVTNLSHNKKINVFSPIINSHVVAKCGNLKTDAAFWWQKNKKYLKFADELWVVIPKEGYKWVIKSVGTQQEISYFRWGLKKPIKYIFYGDSSATCIKLSCYSLPLKEETFLSLKRAGISLIEDECVCNTLYFHIDDILHFIKTRDTEKYPMNGKDIHKILTLKGMGITSFEFFNN